MRGMSSRQLVEWEQFFLLQSGKAPARKVSEADFRKRFGKRVVKKPKG